MLLVSNPLITDDMMGGWFWLVWPVGFLSPDADYADYTTDSAFGRAAPNGRGDADKIRITFEVCLL